LPAFPIADADELALRGRPFSEWREVRALPADQRDAIEALQPYHSTEDDEAYRRDQLDAINKLNTVDKHRHLHVVRPAAIMVGVPTFSVPGRQETFLSSLVGKTQVFRWTFEDSVPPEIDELRAVQNVVADLRLDEGPTEPGRCRSSFSARGCSTALTRS
jgi:hypothetical protein